MYAGGYFGQLYFAGGIDLYNLLVSISDSVEATDDISILNRIPISDDLTSDETLAILASFILQETGSADDVGLGKNINNLSDTGEALDIISSLVNRLTIKEISESTDEVSSSNTFVLSDNSSGIDNISIAVYKTFVDSATASEILDINNKFTLSDVGYLIDLASVLNMISLDDSGEAVDSASAIVQNIIIELIHSIEQLVIRNHFSLSEAINSQEYVNITATLSLTDDGSLVDSFSILNRVPISDLGSAIDTVVSKIKRSLLKVSVKTDKPGYILSVSTNKVGDISLSNKSVDISVRQDRYVGRSTIRNRSTGGFAYMVFGGMAFASAPEPMNVTETTPRQTSGQLKVSNKPSTISIKDIL